MHGWANLTGHMAFFRVAWHIKVNGMKGIHIIHIYGHRHHGPQTTDARWLFPKFFMANIILGIDLG